MNKHTLPQTPTKPFSQSPNQILLTFLLMLEKVNISPAVKDHCKTGLLVIEIIYQSQLSKNEPNALLHTKFDAFFKCFPAYAKRRKALAPDIIIDHILSCIKKDAVVVMAGG